MTKRTQRTVPSPERILDFVQTFNRTAALDEDFARQLPAHEFELSFDQVGNVYIDGKPIDNVKRRQRAPLRVKVTGWNNGEYSPTGAGYGLRLNPKDRDAVFDRSWSDVTLDLPNSTTVRVTLSPSFWRDCPELRSAKIGRWLIRVGHSRWRQSSPPSFTLVQVSGNHFKVV
jgi:hypothetical protein